MSKETDQTSFSSCATTSAGVISPAMAGSTPTPRIDKLAGEGIRFNNYTVESQCTPTRSAILTGRQSVRSGTYQVPMPGEGKSGLVPWEYTIAELLSDAGYATSLWGKWHLGDIEGRLPNDQGFDEWWGYKNSVDEAGWTSYAAFRALVEGQGVEPPQIWEGKKGSNSTPVRELNLQVRPFLDELIVGKATDYIKRRPRRQAVLHLRRALARAPAGGRCIPISTRPIPRGWDCTRTHGRNGLPGRADRRLRGRGRDRRQHDHRVLQRQRRPGVDVPTFGFGGSSGPWRGGFFTPPVGGVDAGPGDGPLARHSAGRA